MKKSRKWIRFVLVCCLVLSAAVMPVYGAGEAEGKTTAPVLAAPKFADVEGHWAEKTIKRWADYHIIQGYGGMFRPEDKIAGSEFLRCVYNEEAGRFLCITRNCPEK